MTDETKAVNSIDTLRSLADDQSLAIFKLGVVWAGIWIGGTEFTGISDEDADKMGRLLRREAERLTAIPNIPVLGKDGTVVKV